MELEILFDEFLHLAIVSAPSREDLPEVDMVAVGRVVVEALKASGYIVNEKELSVLEHHR